jgi:hypothetical protein
VECSWHRCVLSTTVEAVDVAGEGIDIIYCNVNTGRLEGRCESDLRKWMRFQKLKKTFTTQKFQMRKNADLSTPSLSDLCFTPHETIPFLYTRSIPKPTFKTTIKELRTILRITQLTTAIASFIALALSTVVVNYSYALLSVSGVNFMCLVSLSSMVCIFYVINTWKFVSFSCLFLYFYPSFLGVPPHRHHRFSRIEV